VDCVEKSIEAVLFFHTFYRMYKENDFFDLKNNECVVFTEKIMISLSSYYFTRNVLSLKSVSSITMLLLKIKIKINLSKRFLLFYLSYINILQEFLEKFSFLQYIMSEYSFIIHLQYM
jgi:hypothetical protein